MNEATEKQIVKREENEPESVESAPRFVPQVDIIERADELAVIADVPGTKSEDVDISIEDDVLTLRAKVEPCECPDLPTLYSEYSVGHFVRTFTLGREIDQSAIQAELKNGVLRLVLPKLKEAQSRKIEVKTG